MSRASQVLTKGECYIFEIRFFKDRNGNEPVLDYIRSLESWTDKDSRIRLSKINDYIQILSAYGTYAGEPYLKHIEGNLWELRPLRDRIFFVGWDDNSFVLLHHFLKRTQKTPKREIEQAKRELAYLQKKGLDDEEK